MTLRYLFEPLGAGAASRLPRRAIVHKETKALFGHLPITCLPVGLGPGALALRDNEWPQSIRPVSCGDTHGFLLIRNRFGKAALRIVGGLAILFDATAVPHHTALEVPDGACPSHHEGGMAFGNKGDRARVLRRKNARRRG